MKPRIDIHNHTVASGHAFSTLQEMVHAAAEKEIEYFGITDHAPAVPGACDPLYFYNYRSVPRLIYGVKLLLGCELNILDPEGNIDLEDSILSRMDLRIAGIHRLCWTPGTKEQNTDSVLKVMGNPWVNMISHPGDGTAELDFEALVKASRDTRTLLEINSSSMEPARKKTVARPNNIEILNLCKKYDVPVMVGADAHISFNVAKYDYVLPLLEETSFPEELILNNDPEAFFAFTGLEWHQ